MFKFTISYHYEKYHTGDVIERTKRTMSVYAPDLGKAVEKVKAADKDYLCITDNGVVAEEILMFTGGKKENDREENLPWVCF